VTIDTYGYRQPNYRRFQQDLYRKVAVDPTRILLLRLAWLCGIILRLRKPVCQPSMIDQTW
jgi:hypothetical protein